jgi:hypothetical protein
VSDRRRLILVTGAPRTATTPVGNMLARCRGTVSLYEPLGPTGLARIGDWYPMVGPGLGLERDDLSKLLNDLRAFRFGAMKSQERASSRSKAGKIFGSRTLHSFRLARLQPWARTVIWKDPHAILLVPDLVEAGLDVVVTARTPWAHAASYKRLGWRSKAVEIYPRWSSRYGPCDVCERFLDRGHDSVVSAALLWRLSYLSLIRTGSSRKIHLVTSEELERDERRTYLRLIEGLGLTPDAAVAKSLSRPRREQTDPEPAQKVHDWTRSVASVNSYWKDVLTAGELESVQALTSDIVGHFFSGGPGTQSPVTAPLPRIDTVFM